jgi:hypothetical protein
METILAAILGFFMFPAVGFWLGLVLLSVVYTFATEQDCHGWAVFSTIIGVILFWKTIVLGFAIWPLLILGLAAYALIGGGWSVYRWFRYCRTYIQENPYKSVNEHEKVSYSSGKPINLEAHDYYRKKLQPNEHKSKLVGWIIYWPWSLIWNFIGDIVTTIYDSLVNVYQKTADAVIRKASAS